MRNKGSKLCNCLIAPAYCLREFLGSCVGRGNPNRTQQSPRVEKIELEVWRGQNTQTLQGRVQEGKCCTNSGDLQRVPFKLSAEYQSEHVCEETTQLGREPPKRIKREKYLLLTQSREQCLFPPLLPVLYDPQSIRQGTHESLALVVEKISPTIMLLWSYLKEAKRDKLFLRNLTRTQNKAQEYLK